MWRTCGICLFFAQLIFGGSILEVTNTGDTPGTLSGLVAYGAGGAGQSKKFLEPFNVIDDVTVRPHGSEIFNAGFDVRMYFFSETVGGQEYESIITGAQQLGPTRMTRANTAAPNSAPSPFALERPYSPGNPSLPTGPFGVSSGKTPLLPGWTFGFAAFVGSADLRGSVNGPISVSPSPFNVTVQAAPPPGTSIKFDNPNRFTTPGGTVRFSGAIQNTTQSTVFVKSDTITKPPQFSANDRLASSLPIMLAAAQSFSGSLFDVIIPPGTPEGVYAGSLDLFGGPHSESADLLASAPFTVTVVPEPGTWVLLAAGVILIPVLRRRRLSSSMND